MPRSFVTHFNRSRSSSQNSHEPVHQTIENVLSTRPGPLPVVGKKQHTSGTVSSLGGKSSLLSSSPASLPSTSSPAFVRDSNGSLHDGRFYDSLKALEIQLASTPSPFASSFSSHTVPRPGRRPYSPRSDSDSDDSHRRRTSRNRADTNALQLSTSLGGDHSDSEASSDSASNCDRPATRETDDQWPPSFSPSISMQPFDEEVEELQLSQALQHMGSRDRPPHTRRSHAYSTGLQRTSSPFNTSSREQRRAPHSHKPEGAILSLKNGPLNEEWQGFPDESTGGSFSAPASHHLPQLQRHMPSRHSLAQSSTDISRSTSWSPRWRTMALSPSNNSVLTANSTSSGLSIADQKRIAQRASLDEADLPADRKHSPGPSLRHAKRLSGAASGAALISHRALSFIFSDRERSAGGGSARASPQLEPVKDEWVSGFTSFVDLQESARARLRAQSSTFENTTINPATSSSSIDPKTRRGSLGVPSTTTAVAATAAASSESPRSVVLNLAMGSSPNAPIPGIGGRWFEDEARRLSALSRPAYLAAHRCVE